MEEDVARRRRAARPHPPSPALPRASGRARCPREAMASVRTGGEGVRPTSRQRLCIAIGRGSFFTCTVAPAV